MTSLVRRTGTVGRAGLTRLALERMVGVSGVKPNIILTSQSPLCHLLASVVLVVVRELVSPEVQQVTQHRALQLAQGGDRVEANNITQIVLAVEILQATCTAGAVVDTEQV